MSVLLFGAICQVDVEISQWMCENFLSTGALNISSTICHQGGGARDTPSATQHSLTQYIHVFMLDLDTEPWQRLWQTSPSWVDPLRATCPPLKTEKKNYLQHLQVLHTWREDLWKSKLDIAANEFFSIVDVINLKSNPSGNDKNRNINNDNCFGYKVHQPAHTAHNYLYSWLFSTSSKLEASNHFQRRAKQQSAGTHWVDTLPIYSKVRGLTNRSFIIAKTIFFSHTISARAPGGARQHRAAVCLLPAPSRMRCVRCSEHRVTSVSRASSEQRK